MSHLLEAHDLFKHYRDVKAVDGISFSIEKGTCFGLLGPNGAGKTTTVEMLEGIVSPTSGRILYQGEPLGARFRDEAGIMFQKTALQEFITVRETLELFRRFYTRSHPLAELVRECALEEFLERDTRKLSGGQMQRLLLGLALINDPEVVFLDEPTTGLDPQSRRNFWELVHAIKSRHKTLVLTTHYMEEAHELCDRIVIMDHGRIIAEGAPRQLLAAHYKDVVLSLPAADLPPELLDGDLTGLKQIRDLVEISSSDINATIDRLIGLGVPLNRLHIRSRTLEDLFLELTGRELRG